MKNIFFVWFWTLLLMASIPVHAQQAREPLIAVAANGNTPSASVSSQPVRCPNFLLFDSQGVFLETLNNAQRDEGNAANLVADLFAVKRIKVFVAESFGPRVVGALKDKGIRLVEFKGSAAEAAKSALMKK